ncbi:hypothetical protein [Penaeicola halotolerans]|uniref:hypothetical protein n=1 Tax=Penaeicola halotolerans TaxID=2793196 RepID=UPI001CF89063|nr:hypothetical protein [Penaeicola halotolerans]
MKPYILAILLLNGILFSTKAIAQSNYAPGYVVTHQGDTLRGEVRDRKSQVFNTTPYQKIRLKGHGLFPKKFSAKDIKAYKRGDDLYHSIWIKLRTERLKANYDSRPGLGKPQFMKVILSDYLSLYEWEQPSGDNSDPIYVPFFKREGEDYLVRATQGLFGLKRQNLEAYFQDCPPLQAQIKAKEINTAFDVAVYYNEYIKDRRAKN